MKITRSDGAALAETLVALVLLGTLALATVPPAVHTASLFDRGRGLLAGSDLAARRLALERLSGTGRCGPAGSGRDSTPRAVLEWRSTSGDSMITFLAILRDPGGRWPAESLATAWGCTP